MRKSSLLGHILEVLALVHSQTQPADAVLGEFFRSRHYLGSTDRRFVAEIVYGILRNHFLLEAYIAAARAIVGQSREARGATPLEFYIAYARVILKEDPSTLLPDVATLSHDVMRGESTARFLDAIDRSTVPPADADPVRRLALSHSLPESIVREWVERFGEEEAGNLCAASNLPAPVTIRVNTLRATREECQSLLQADGVQTTKTMLSPVGLKLEKRLNIQSLRAFREGAIEMQDEGSQLLSFLLEPAPDSRVVDACAGAGGKTLHIAALMGNTGSILAVDTEWRRLDALRQRAERAGVVTVALCQAGDTRIDSWKGRADAVLIDAPCTGVGTFRRNPGAKMGFAKQSVAASAVRQLSILEEYSMLVRPGGRLVYATCTLLEAENEGVVTRFLRDHPEFHLTPAPEILLHQGIALSSPSPFLTLLPHRTTTDGFFGAVLEKVRE